jgi:histidine ammonia-lyase
MKKFIITKEHLSLADIRTVLEENLTVVLSDECKNAVQKCRTYLDKAVAEQKDLIYGINTGFGSLCNTAIDADQLGQLQVNLVRSHACGTGEEVDGEIVRMMLLLKAIGLSKGHSGVQLETIERLLHFYNNDVLPVIYQQGSLGASGDLAPLAHLTLPLMGEGEVRVNGEKIDAALYLKENHLTPIALQSKEGLALLNGTQFMSAYGLWSVLRGEEILHAANAIASISLEAYDGRLNPFYENVNRIRQQAGQIAVAQEIRSLLAGSEMITLPKVNVQDPYSFRCIPQVHGASIDALNYVSQIIENEINAVTDNPTIFPDEDQVISAGNFHGQPLAISMDFLAIAFAEIGSISERRTYKLIGGTRNLPAFLVENPGLNSGYMIPQYAQASIVSQNKQLCSPASIDTIDSSNGQEDHVSMGANAATKLFRVVENVYQILGIELMNASQAFEHRRPYKSSTILEKIVKDYRENVPLTTDDVYMHPRMIASKQFVKNELWKNLKSLNK